jgi:hypothetical protein
MTNPFYTPPSAIKLTLQWAKASGTLAESDIITLDQYGIASNGNWQHCSIPFTAFRDSTYNGTTYNFVGQPGGNDGIKHFNGVVFNVGISSAEFFVDNLVLKKPSTSTGFMSAVLKNRSDNSTAANLTWSGVTLGTTKWLAADQYIQLQTDYYDVVMSSMSGRTWGIEIYTNNKSAGASPRYTGTGNPAGLVSITTTTQVLPMCWRIVDVSTTSLSIVQAGPSPDIQHLYSSELGGYKNGAGFPCFLWMKDKNTAGFIDSDDYITVWDARGIQYAETARGGALPPNYIYLGADFTSALTPGIYDTGTLTLELFHD